MSREHSLPLLTIGIPVKNRAWCIQKILKSIENVDYRKDRLKLVFVDDYSTDGTFEIIEEWKTGKGNLFREIVLVRGRTNIPRGRNLCIRHMEGDYLLFWDSDVLPPRDLLRQMVDMLESNGKVGMIGADYLYEGEGVWTHMLGEPVTNKVANAVYMGFTLIRRGAFEGAGGFNELLDVGEDTEFGIRVVEKTGYKIMWAPKPVLHLKPAGEGKRIGHGFGWWLSYNFHVRGKQYAESFQKLPLLLRVRIPYYALLPLLIAFLSFLAHYIGLTLVVLVFVAYLLPALLLNIRGSNIRKGVISFFTFNIPTGVMLSYGVLLHKVKKSLKGSDIE